VKSIELYFLSFLLHSSNKNSVSPILQVPELDPFETVLTMRRQRVKLVQKPIQYHYMIKCLADYVVGETSVYV
jgi:protein tyrosine phosphatase